MSTKTPIKAGDTIWVVKPTYTSRRNENMEPVEYTVTRMGRQYIYALDKGYGRSATHMEQKFHTDTLREYSGPNDVGHYACQAYQYREEWEKKVERDRMVEKVRNYLRLHSWDREMTAEQAQAIINILDIK